MCNSSNTDTHEQLLLLRDGMLFSILWQSCFRGFNALGIYSGQSVHSTRRGNMIHGQQHLHGSYKEIGEAAMCNEKNA